MTYFLAEEELQVTAHCAELQVTDYSLFCARTAKDLKFRIRTFALPFLPKCEVPLPHFRSALTAKDVKFRSALPSCVDCQRSECQLPQFRSALTGKDLKFRFPHFALPGLPRMWSSAFALVLPGLPKMWSSTSAISSLPWSHFRLFQRFEVLLPHFRSALTAKDLKFGFSTYTLPSLPKMWCCASALPLCLDCQRPVVLLPHFCSAFIPRHVKLRFRILLCLDCQSSASSVLLYVHIYFHTISCCLTWLISASERGGIFIRRQNSKPSNRFYC